MSSSRPVALVTGANKGIGFAITRDLCRKFSGDVVLAARDEERGQTAVQKLQAEGLSPRFHQLDIDNPQSIRALRDFLLKEYGGLDVLVNNAGIAFKVNDDTPFHIQAEVTMKTNFFGTRDVCKELLPLIKPQGRVVNVSSMVSLRALKNCRLELQQKFRSETITEEELVGLMNKFVEDTKKGVHAEEGWPNSAYGVTKIGDQKPPKAQKKEQRPLCTWPFCLQMQRGLMGSLFKIKKLNHGEPNSHLPPPCIQTC
ncbi:carbonyl reductase 1, isoform CRA_b [Mus musculus]|nr:carbonyl reductase 1, isoform CRA_b [Mus musculus]